jgi:hypothetical protein
MEDTKLLQLLRTLETAGLRKVGEMTRSPFFNKDERVIQLFESLLPFAPAFSGEGLEKKTVHEAAFPEEAFDDKSFRYTISALTAIIKEYFVQYALEADPFIEKELLFGEYGRRKLDKFQSDTVRALEKALEKDPCRSDSYFLRRHTLLYDSFQLGESEKGSGKDPEAWIRDLDTYYLIRKLRSCCFLLNRQQVVGQRFSLPLLDELLLHLKYNPYPGIPAIRMYRNLLMMLRYPTQKELFDAFLIELESEKELFPEEERRNLYLYALNYCARRLRAGETAFREKIFGIYKKMLEAELLGEEIQSRNYKNIVVIGLKCGDFHWVKDFLHTYKNQLPLAERENMFLLGSALLSFHRKSFQEILPLLNGIETQDLFFQLEIRELRMKTYFELNEVDPLLSLIEATRKYIKRARIPDRLRSGKMNFLRVLRHLTLARDASKSLLSIRKEIDMTVPLEEKEWLLEKVYEWG